MLNQDVNGYPLGSRGTGVLFVQGIAQMKLDKTDEIISPQSKGSQRLRHFVVLVNVKNM